MRFKKNLKKLIKIFKEVVNSKPLGSIWTSVELMKEINKYSSNFKFRNTYQLGHLIRIQKDFNVFRKQNLITQYIFSLKNKGGVNE